MATRVWEYRHAPGFFCMALGSHQTTPDRRHCINYGFNFRPNPSVTLVDDARKRRSELFFADSFMSYRSFLFDLPVNDIQRPAITCSQNGGLVTLSAPPGYDRYEWSTGETSASIDAAAAGVYQVWVNYGSGMLGSEPFVIQQLDSACPVSSVPEADVVKSQTVVAYYDLLGRRIGPPPYPGRHGQLYVVRFEDGRSQLRFY